MLRLPEILVVFNILLLVLLCLAYVRALNPSAKGLGGTSYRLVVLSYLIVFSIQAALISLRENLGSDTCAYDAIFASFYDSIDGYNSYEPIFRLYGRALGLLGLQDLIYWKLLLCILNVCIVWLISMSFRGSNLLLFLIFLQFTYIAQFANTVRNGHALLLVMLLLTVAQSRAIMRIPLLILAIGTHITALIALPFVKLGRAELLGLLFAVVISFIFLNYGDVNLAGLIESKVSKGNQIFDFQYEAARFSPFSMFIRAFAIISFLCFLRVGGIYVSIVAAIIILDSFFPYWGRFLEYMIGIAIILLGTRGHLEASRSKLLIPFFVYVVYSSLYDSFRLLDGQWVCEPIL